MLIKMVFMQKIHVAQAATTWHWKKQRAGLRRPFGYIW